MTKFCPECSTQQRDDNVRFCSNCGFDFSKIENKEDSKGIIPETFKIDITGSDDSNKSSPSSVQSAGANSSNKSSPKVSATRTNDSKKSSSSGQINKNASSDGLLSNLSFNKCFFAFAALLILLTIFGMILQVTETEPSSDYGLTSFMESSDGYSIDNSYYYDDSDSNSNYLSYSILSFKSSLI
ncbi:MAG: zinc ribbon domain-containing protein [archaeon]|nr:zinc ribbon domain-containing protein [archaeon]